MRISYGAKLPAVTIFISNVSINGRRVSLARPSVYCRTPWEKELKDIGNLKNITKTGGRIGPDGYINVADELGISPHRDTSTYHIHWSGHGSRYW